MKPFRIDVDCEQVCVEIEANERQFRIALDRAVGDWCRVVKGWREERFSVPAEALRIKFELLDPNEPEDRYGNVDVSSLLLLPCDAGPIAYLPMKGTIRLKKEKLPALEDAGALVYALKHEIGHVLGLGTVWEAKGLVAGTFYDPVFTGAAAKRAYLELQEMANHPQPTLKDVPLDAVDFNSFTHWSESIFGDEIMTPVLIRGRLNAVSKLTAAALEDMGYLVDYAAIDLSYSLPAAPEPVPAAAVPVSSPAQAARQGSDDEDRPRSDRHSQRMRERFHCSCD